MICFFPPPLMMSRPCLVGRSCEDADAPLIEKSTTVDPARMDRGTLLSNGPSLVVVRMAVAPIPVVPLHSVVLPVVLKISPVLFCQVTPVGMFFVVVPVVVIAVVPIVNSDLDTSLLSFRFSHKHSRCNNGGSQEK